jgi:hypothetical protein
MASIPAILILNVAIVCASFGSAQGPRAPVVDNESMRVIVRMNDAVALIVKLKQSVGHSDAKQVASLFAPDGDLWIGNEIAGKGPEEIEGALEKPAIWSEMTAPNIQNESVRLVSDDVALVNANQAQYGSVILRKSVPITILLKYAGGRWQIVTMRLNQFCITGGLPGISQPQ